MTACFPGNEQDLLVGADRRHGGEPPGHPARGEALRGGQRKGQGGREDLHMDCEGSQLSLHSG